MSLRQKLSRHGFESNDDYDFALRCLFDAPVVGLRCVNLAGASGRRKTAFAQALGLALEFDHRLYHDFSRPPAASVAMRVDEDEPGEPLITLTALERIVLEACAFSEAARCLLVLDQLQCADFAEQVRLYQFIHSRQWEAAGAHVIAHPRNLLVVLICEGPLYHSLHKASFRVWTDPSHNLLDFKPEDLALPSRAQAMMGALSAVFIALGSAPTLGEYQRLVDDAAQRIYTAEQLRAALYGRMETVDRERLYARQLDAVIDAAVAEIASYVGIEEISLSSDL